MISINAKTLILRPIWEVFDFIATPENNYKWQYGSLESVQITEGRKTIGTVFSSLGHFMGRRIQSTFQVTEFISNKNYGFKTLSGPIQLKTSYSFKAVDHGTTVVVTTQVSPDGFFKLVDPVVARVAKLQFKENLAKLKKLLETRELNHAQ